MNEDRMAQLAESMCFIIQKILRAIEERKWMSLPRLCAHLFRLSYLAALQEERDLHPSIIVRLPDDSREWKVFPLRRERYDG
jgi:hypothetical protein